MISNNVNKQLKGDLKWHFVQKVRVETKGLSNLANFLGIFSNIKDMWNSTRNTLKFSTIFFSALTLIRWAGANGPPGV